MDRISFLSYPGGRLPLPRSRLCEGRTWFGIRPCLLGVDMLLRASPGADLDLSRLRFLRDRDAQRQDAGLVNGSDVVRIERVAQDQLGSAGG